ncbi:MAG TPA: glutamate carboxypeptidase [Phycisphaerales bacterium]|nr:glutamate carboxypeptidase [Phycisphaerales bacterium]
MAVGLAGAAPEPPAATHSGLNEFAPDRRDGQREYESALNSVASAAGLREFHDLLASEPHIAGSAGDMRQIERLASAFRAMGLETEIDWFWAYLPHPISAELEIVAPERKTLSVQEPPIEADPATAHPDLTIGWNGHSGSGEVTSGVVYANYGTKDDFAELRRLGVDARGKIVLARYGGNYRGYKAKFAEEAGAVGLIIYTDPADSGYMRGLMYPEGGWATAEQIQRGSIKVIPWAGDALTPGVKATEHAERLDPEMLDLPRIPVQPVGWGAAQAIMEQMKGAGVPEKWQGAMPFPYRLEGGPDLRVRLKVEQERRITRTANVTGTLRGTTKPDQLVIVGAHHDAWCHGAADPTCGTMLVMEAARSFSELARRGERPERSVVFGGWGAEEMGIVGSVEWVEGRREELLRKGVAYINLDASTMGPLFNASGAASLAGLVREVTTLVPQARDPETTVFEEWSSRSRATGAATAPGAPPRVQGMGGGSDHIGFAFFVGVPSLSAGSGGARGTAYHSNYDTLRWYRQVVGDDYEPGLMNTRVVNLLLARLSRADVLPLRPSAWAGDLRDLSAKLVERAKALSVQVDPSALVSATEAFEPVAQRFEAALRDAVARGGDSLERARRVSDDLLLTIERRWLDPQGLPGRPWFKHVYMAPDDDSGYSAWPLPVARAAVERGDAAAAQEAISALAARLGDIGAALEQAGAGL